MQTHNVFEIMGVHYLAEINIENSINNKSIN